MAVHVRDHFLPATATTRRAVWISMTLVLSTAAFLAGRYPALPDLLPVHFTAEGVPNGWQFRTLPRVLMPVFVQAALFVSVAGIGALLLSRRDARRAGRAADVRAAQAASEAVILIALIWIGFQAYAAFALAGMWAADRPMGWMYTALEVGGIVLTGIVGARAQSRLDRPAPLPYVAAHWRWKQLYCNADDPALFVPTRDGRRWTLNFGRPAAVMLLGGVLAMGVLLPLFIARLALRS
jgi:uncharacterized membrane protein